MHADTAFPPPENLPGRIEYTSGFSGSGSGFGFTVQSSGCSIQGLEFRTLLGRLLEQSVIIEGHNIVSVYIKRFLVQLLGLFS